MQPDERIVERFFEQEPVEGRVHPAILRLWWQCRAAGLAPGKLDVALLADSAVALARSVVTEAGERRHEADANAEMVRLLPRTRDLRSALPTVSQHLARALGLPSRRSNRKRPHRDDHRIALPLMQGAARLGTLVMLPDLPEATMRRLRERVVPALEALLQAARDRMSFGHALQASRDELRWIAQEQAALRRVATLVARGASTTEMFNGIAGEMGPILQAPCTMIGRYEPDETLVVVGSWSGDSLATHCRWVRAGRLRGRAFR